MAVGGMVGGGILFDTRCGCRDRWWLGMAQLRSRGSHRSNRRI